MDFGEETRRHTSWWQKGAVGGSAGWISGRRRDDALSGGRTVPWEGQQDFWEESDETTHELVEEQVAE